MTTHTSGADTAASAAILLQRGLGNHGWELHTRPDTIAFEIRRGPLNLTIDARPVPGHGSWWWHCGRLPIATVGDTDRALHHINNTIGPARGGSR